MNELPIFLDFEASSLRFDSHPIEVGWSDKNGDIQSFLIKPEPSWTDWDDYAEHEVHGISREQLQAEGVPASLAVARMTQALSGRDVIVSEVEFDAVWCRKLFNYRGLLAPGPIPFRFFNFRDLLKSHFGPSGRPSDALVDRTMARVREEIDGRHRAAADVAFLRDVFISLSSGY